MRRVLAPNPGVMTGPGTNTYLVGTSDLAVIDPGPADEGHLDAVAAAGEGRIRWILATHTHPDHAPGAAGLAEMTGAGVYGFGARDSFIPDEDVGEGWTVGDPAFHLRALHTPGHASNHLCYLLEEEGLLFSGDHVMSGSTVVISPPDGDMAAYLESLARVTALDPPLSAIAPGHGGLIEDPASALATLVAHRLEREERVASALRGAGRATVGELVAGVYADVDAGRHPIARRSLWAHLRKLVADGRAGASDRNDPDTTWWAL